MIRHRTNRTIAFGLALASALYVSNAAFGNPGDAVCTEAAALSAKLSPFAKGEIAAVQVQDKPKPVPDLTFTIADGTTRKLSDFRGRTVLLNLWATWCAPCRLEMPALDRLQATLGGKTGETSDFEVVAVNIDTRNPDKPKQFLSEMKIEKLAYYADPSAKIYQDLKAIGKAFGMPTTMLIGKDGCELAYLAGPAEWSSSDALALVGAAMGK